MSPYLNLPRRSYAQTVMERQPPIWIVVYDCWHPDGHGKSNGQHAEYHDSERRAIDDAVDMHGHVGRLNSFEYAYTIIVEKGVVRAEVWDVEQWQRELPHYERLPEPSRAL